MELISIAVIAALILGFGSISGRIQKSIITPPMVFVLFGLLVCGRLLGLFDIERDSEVIDRLAKITLVLVLFTDASRINLKLLRREHDIPIRLLVVGLPLTIAAGSLLAALVLTGLTFWEGLVLAVILAPTDAALGQAVVSNPRVPVRIRQALNIESGLNDGIALPILLFVVALAGAIHLNQPIASWIGFAAMQLVLGPAVGISVGYLGGRMVSWGTRSAWMNPSFQRLAALGISLLCFALAELIGGNGFIAAFCAGLTIGNTSRSVCSCLYEFAEAEGQLLTLLIFMIFGTAMVWPALGLLDGWILLYAVMSLTAVRMLPVALSLIGMGLRPQTMLFLGWFGPRGIASILYGLIVLKEVDVGGREEIFATMTVTVLLSVFAHGLTAWPASRWYSAHSEKMREAPGMPELAPVNEMPVRLSMMPEAD